MYLFIFEFILEGFFFYIKIGMNVGLKIVCEVIAASVTVRALIPSNLDDPGLPSHLVFFAGESMKRNSIVLVIF